MPEQGDSMMRDAGVSRADRAWLRWQSFCDAAKVPTDTLLSYEELAAAYEHETGTSCPVQYVVSLVHAVSDEQGEATWRTRWRSYRGAYWDLRKDGCPPVRAALLATGAWCYWPLSLLFPSGDDPIERALHGATIIEHDADGLVKTQNATIIDDEDGIIVKTQDGRLYALEFIERDGVKMLGVTRRRIKGNLMTDDDPLNLKGLLAQLFAKEPSDEERHAAIERRLTIARGLWHGDDTDAQVARELLDACEALLKTATTHGAISQILHRGMMKIMSGAVDTIDTLIQIGIVRATAQGHPTPGEPEWLTRDEK